MRCVLMVGLSGRQSSPTSIGNMTRALAVAIDGPAGAGKSTVSRALALKTGFALLDTGAMYRAYTWAYLKDRESYPHISIAESAIRHEISVTFHEGSTLVRCDGRDITRDIRSVEVTAAVSEVSAVAEVRDLAVELQRHTVATELSSGRGVILEGRDIGSTVLPNAEVKFFLTADPSARAARRGLETGQEVSEVIELIQARDLADSTREQSPLRKAEDAIEIDATHLSADEVVEVMHSRILDVASL